MRGVGLGGDSAQQAGDIGADGGDLAGQERRIGPQGLGNHAFKVLAGESIEEFLLLLGDFVGEIEKLRKREGAGDSEEKFKLEFGHILPR